MFTIKKDGSMWLVISDSTGLVQFRSLTRANCKDWLARAGASMAGQEAR